MEIELKAGLALCVKYVLPVLKKIAVSAISKIGKSTYEKLYDKFIKALESFTHAVEKLLEAEDIEKIKKDLICCELGYKFFEKIKVALDKALLNFANALSIAEARFQDKGGNLEEIRGGLIK